MQKSLQYATLIACMVAVISTLFASNAIAQQRSAEIYVAPKPPPADVVFYDEMQKEYSLDDFKGQVVILNFWATWCGYCKMKMPKLEALEKKFGRDKLHVISISQDFNGAQAVLPYMERSGSQLKPYFDHRNQAYRSFGGRSLPYVLLVNKDGKVAARIDGYDLESKEFHQYVSGLL